MNPELELIYDKLLPKAGQPTITLDFAAFQEFVIVSNAAMKEVNTKAEKQRVRNATEQIPAHLATYPLTPSETFLPTEPQVAQGIPVEEPLIMPSADKVAAYQEYTQGKKATTKKGGTRR